MPPKTMTAPRDLLVLTEKQWQRLVTDTADLFGWMWEHFPQMIGNPKGFPDLILIKDGRVIFAELKTQNGKISDDQKDWHARAADNGVRVHVWRPEDWPWLVRVLGEGYDVEGV